MSKKPNEHTSNVWVLLNLAHRHLVSTAECQLARAGLPNTRWYEVLWILERDGTSHGLRQFELERAGLLDQPNLSRTLKQMVDQGLVTSSKDENDGRGRVLRITEHGRALRAKMWDIYGQFMVENIEEHLASDHVERLIADLRELMPEDQRR